MKSTMNITHHGLGDPKLDLQGIFDVSYFLGTEVPISGRLRKADWKHGDGRHYAVIEIGDLTIFTPHGAETTHNFLKDLRDVINLIEMEIPVMEVS